VSQKVVQTHGDNFVNSERMSILNGFSQLFHCWKAR